jgi:Flp pilus assembly protein TadD
MNTKKFLGRLATASLVLALTVIAAPAFAQIGGVSGKVVDEKGNPVADAEVLISNPSNVGTTKLTTNAKGEYAKLGIPPTDYQIRVSKGNLTGKIDRIHIGSGGATVMPTITLKAGGAAGGAAPVSPEEAEKINKKNAEMLAKFKGAQAAVDAGNLDQALTEFNAVAAEMPNCDLCYLQIADVNLKKKDEAAAETAFKKAIEINPSNSVPYAALASLYNGQKKFDLANQMSAKATELMSATGSSDPVAYVNQGIILWNQSKTAEAKAQFEKAAQLDPKNADAHYWLGMALVNEGNMADAGKHMKEYLSLAPTGQYADTAKAILDSAK